MKVGSLVICVDDSPGVYACGIKLVNGDFYVISAIIANGNGVRLEEDPYIPPNIDPEYYGFFTRRFREVQPPMEINIERIIAEHKINPFVNVP